MVFDRDFMAVSYNTITAAVRIILYGICSGYLCLSVIYTIGASVRIILYGI